MKPLLLIAAICILTVSGFAQQNVQTLQNAATTNGNGTVMAVGDYAGVGVTVTVAGGFDGTVNFELSLDNFNASVASVLATKILDYTQATSTTAAGSWYIATGGFTGFRARISGRTTGSVTVLARPSPYLFAKKANGYNPLTLTEISAPATPGANQVYLYAKDSGGVSSLYFKKDDGTEINLATAGGTGLTSLNGQTGGTQTFANDTNVTISSASDTHTLGWSGTLPVSRGGSGAGTLTGLLKGNGTSAFTVVTTSSGLAGVISDETGSGALVFGTGPSLSGGSHVALTGLGIRSTGTGAFDLTLANTENLSAGHTLTLTLNNADRGLTVAGNATVSGINTGDQTITLSGDASGSGTSGVAVTFATVNSNVGSFGSASKAVSFTVNGKGLVTAASEANIAIAESQVTSLVSDLAGKAATGAVGSSGLTMNTARLLGRSTASSGAIEEITVGSGLSLSGGTLSASGGGGGTPGGSDTQVQFNDASAFGGSSKFTFNKTTGATAITGPLSLSPAADTVPLTITGGGVTGSGTSSSFTITDTWNTSGNVTGLSYIITNTASGASSKIFDYKISSQSILTLLKTGEMQLSVSNGGTTIDFLPTSSRGAFGTITDDPLSVFTFNGNYDFSFYSNVFSGRASSVFAWSSSATDSNLTKDTGLARGAAGKAVINQGSGTSGNGDLELTNIVQLGKTTTYNNVATAGYGHPSIVAAGRVTAQSAANASIATFTVGASDGSFEVSANMNVTAATALATTLTVTYTDESNTARSMILPIQQLSGSFIATGAITGTGAWESPVMHIRCKASTAITILTSTGTFTGVVYTAEGIIKQVA